MRIYKIVLIIILIILTFGTCVGIYDVYQVEYKDTIFLSLMFFVSLGVILSFLSLYHHIKSFHNYRTSIPYKAENRVARILRICSVACGVFYSVFAGLSFTGLAINNELHTVAIIALVLIFLFGFFNILEAVLTRKQIKKLKIEHETKDGIETIGNSTF